MRANCRDESLVFPLDGGLATRSWARRSERVTAVLCVVGLVLVVSSQGQAPSHIYHLAVDPLGQLDLEVIGLALHKPFQWGPTAMIGQHRTEEVLTSTGPANVAG